MSETLELKAKGLCTHPNDLDSVPQGALLVADNVVIDKENTISLRRGYDTEATFSDPADRASRLFAYQGNILASYTGNKLAYLNGSSWTDLSGTYAPPSGYSINSTQANSNFYFTTNAGVKKLDAFNGTVIQAGAPAGLNGQASLTGASGFMPDNSQVAYRVVWGYRDANDNLIIGAPSQRIVIANAAGGTRDVSLTFTVPSSVTTSWFYQVYRSAASASSSTEPSDELGLVFEGNPSAGQITARSVTLTDQTPNSLRGADLYTNASQEGLANQNNPPPLARDIATYRGYTFYANTTSKHRFFFDILAVGGTNGIALDNTITIAGEVYTAKAAENVSADEFLLETGGTPAQNIADTARSLVKVINESSSTTSVYAYYLSGPNDLPGKILIEERIVGGSAFNTVASANGGAYNPNLSTSRASTNDRGKNKLFFSKPFEPEAVPLPSFRNVGSAEAEILRIEALRDSLFIFKEDGIFRLSGETEQTFVVDLFDRSTVLLAADSVQTLNNQIFAYTDQGIVSVSEAGVQVRSRMIERTLLELYGVNPAGMENLSFGVAYESERKYLFSCISNSGDTFPTQIYVYNVVTDSWTRWPLSKRAGIVLESVLYWADGASDRLSKERKSYNFTDYADEPVAVTINSSSGNEVTLANASEVEVGDVLYDSDTAYSIVLAVNGNVVTVFDEIVWPTGAAEIRKGYEALVEWWPQTGQNPGMLKQFQELIMLFNRGYFTESNIRFYSDLSVSVDSVPILGNYGSAWGLFQWGGVPWGGDSFKSFGKRIYVTRNKQRCSQLSVQYQQRVAYGEFEIQGVHLSLRGVSNRIGR